MTPLPRVMACAIAILVGLTFQSTSAQLQQEPSSQGKQALDCIIDAKGGPCHQVSAGLASRPGTKRATNNVAQTADAVRTLLTPAQVIGGMTPAGAKHQPLLAGLMPRQRSS